MFLPKPLAFSILTTLLSLPLAISTPLTRRQTTTNSTSPVGGPGLAPGQVTPFETVTTLPCGTVNVSGITLPSLGVTSFLNIPYALPPIGDLRFAPPQPFVYEDLQTYDGTRWGQACLQANSTGALEYGMGEDCLTINVFRPANVNGSTAEKLPVVAWIYGAFTAGTASLYNATAIIAESIQIQSPVIFVSMNYRLGVFGFGQGAEFAANNATNLGLRDQLLALEWIQTNIASFGGDPSQVTLQGESAGAISIAIHYLNPSLLYDTPTNSSLFRGAIMESGAANTYPLGNEIDTRQNVFDELVILTNCSALSIAQVNGTTEGGTNQTEYECLKNLDAGLLIAAQNGLSLIPTTAGLPFGPAIDGELIPTSPATLLSQGAFAKLPFISGNNEDEGTVFVPRSINSSIAAVGYIDALFPHPPNVSVITMLESFYPNASDGAPFGNPSLGYSPVWSDIAALFGDVSFQAPRRAFLEAAEQYGLNETYTYLFTQNDNPTSPLGVYHGSEVPYAFGLEIIAPASNGSTLLSEQMIAYFLNFINFQDPNGAGPVSSIVASTLNLTTWPARGTQRDMLQLEVANLTVITDDYRQGIIDYANSNTMILNH